MLSRTVTAALAIALPAVGASPSRAHGQDSASATSARLEPAPRIGTRVRATSGQLGPRPVVFTFNGMRSDTLLLRPTRRGAPATAVPLGDVSRLEVSRGWRRRALGGGLVGVVTGAGIGAAVAYNTWEPDPINNPYCFLECSAPTRREDTLLGAFIGATYGAAIGALVGRFVLGERWVRVTPRLAR